MTCSLNVLVFGETLRAPRSWSPRRKVRWLIKAACFRQYNCPLVARGWDGVVHFFPPHSYEHGSPRLGRWGPPSKAAACFAQHQSPLVARFMEGVVHVFPLHSYEHVSPRLPSPPACFAQYHSPLAAQWLAILVQCVPSLSYEHKHLRRATRLRRAMGCKLRADSVL